jgi:glycosyltransferase involved in cell wall biosynthesis
MPRVSVIICCYNSSERIYQTLKALSQQSTYVKWEVVVVDNNSFDNTAERIISIWENFSLSVPLTVFSERQQGLSSSRKLGIQKAQGEIVIFCDDDNWLNHNYVQAAFDILTSNPNVSVLGGMGVPQCEIHPPDWFGQVADNYATGPQSVVVDGEELVDITVSKGYVYGAGAVFRKSALNALLTENIFGLASDRTAAVLLSGGDNEMCYLLRLLGYKVFYSPRLTFYHFIPRSRLTESYLFRLNYGFGYSYVLLLPYRFFFESRPLTGIKTNGYYLLAVSIFQFLLHDVPKMLSLKHRSDLTLKLQLASRRGAIRSLFDNRNKMKSMFRYIHDLSQRFRK